LARVSREVIGDWWLVDMAGSGGALGFAAKVNTMATTNTN